MNISLSNISVNSPFLVARFAAALVLTSFTLALPLPSISEAQSGSSANLRLPNTFRAAPKFRLDTATKLSENLQAESVEDVIRARKQYEDFGLFYQSLLALEDSLNVSLLTELEEDETLAQSIFVYQSLKEAGQYLMSSPSGLSIKQGLSRLKHVKRLTSFRVEQNITGGLSMIGENQADQRVEPLAKFSFHVSIRRGVEPRLTFLDDFVLSYNLFANQTLLEYELNF